MLKQFFFFIKKTRKSKAVFIMFAGHWSLIPVIICKIFSTPCYIILGGSDCVSYPEFNYGSLRKYSLRISIKISAKFCTKLIPVARELMEYNSTYFNSSIKKQGILSFFKNLKTPWVEIPNGYEHADYIKHHRLENSFLSVAKIEDEARCILKGFDQIETLASENKNYNFVLIGITNQNILNRLENIENITTYKFLTQTEIRNHMLAAQFYLQLSISEGHPNALCEAMSQGCIPIGSDVSSIPRIIGDSGFIVPKCNSKEISSQIVKITSNTAELTKEKLSFTANGRINELFSLEQREKLLLDLLTKP
jgi:glycosyltransferase involved in cell wall biosynthesis